MASSDEFVIEIQVDENGSAQSLTEINKNGKRTEKTLKNVESQADSVNNALTRSFSSLITKLVSLGGVIAFAKFVKNIADANLQLRNMAQVTGNSAKSIRALQLAFKNLGYAESTANNGLESFTKSVADFKYNGQLSGQALAFKKLGVAIMDSNNNTRDYYEVMVEGGESALKMFKGDTVKAGEYLRSLGFSQQQVTLMLDKNARENMKTNKESAATSDQAAEAALKLNETIGRLQETFANFVLTIEERLGVFDKMIELMNVISDWCGGKPASDVYGFFNGFMGILDAIETTVVVLVNLGKTIYDYVIQPFIKCLDLVGQAAAMMAGEEYESKEEWFGDGKPILTKNDITGQKNYSFPSFGGGGYAGGSYGASGGGYSYGGAGDDNGSIDAVDVSGSFEDSVSSMISNTFNRFKGMAYQLGGGGNGSIDCSGYLMKIGQTMMRADPAMFHGSNPFADRTAAGITRNLVKLAGGYLSADALSPSRIKAGTIIGTSKNKNNGRYKNIDHIVAVYRDKKTGRMMVTQSSPSGYGTGQHGVQTMEYDKWYAYARNHYSLYGVNVGSISGGNSARTYNDGARQIASNQSQTAERVTNNNQNIAYNSSTTTIFINGGDVHSKIGATQSGVRC